MYPYETVYSLIDNGGMLLAWIINLSQYRAKKSNLSKISLYLQECISQKKGKNYTGFFAFVEMLIFSYVQLMFIGTVNWWFGPLVGTGANYFGTLFVIPAVLTLLCYLVGVHPGKQMDLLTPTFPFLLISVKLVCFCQGCCRGIDWQSGMYNQFYENWEFPVQLVEMGLAAIIFVVLLIYRRKAQTGTVFPMYMILYCATRFFSEFLRREPKTFAFFNTYQVLCIIGVICGIVGYVMALAVAKEEKSAIE